MDTKTVLQAIQEKGFVFDIGQLDAQAKKDLETLVRRGHLAKTKAYWPDIDWGTATKTVYGTTFKIDMINALLAGTKKSKKK